MAGYPDSTLFHGEEYLVGPGSTLTDEADDGEGNDAQYFEMPQGSLQTQQNVDTEFAQPYPEKMPHNYSISFEHLHGTSLDESMGQSSSSERVFSTEASNYDPYLHAQESFDGINNSAIPAASLLQTTAPPPGCEHSNSHAYCQYPLSIAHEELIEHDQGNNSTMASRGYYDVASPSQRTLSNVSADETEQHMAYSDQDDQQQGHRLCSGVYRAAGIMFQGDSSEEMRSDPRDQQHVSPGIPLASRRDFSSPGASYIGSWPPRPQEDWHRRRASRQRSSATRSQNRTQSSASDELSQNTPRTSFEGVSDLMTASMITVTGLSGQDQSQFEQEFLGNPTGNHATQDGEECFSGVAQSHMLRNYLEEPPARVPVMPRGYTSIVGPRSRSREHLQGTFLEIPNAEPHVPIPHSPSPSTASAVSSIPHDPMACNDCGLEYHGEYRKGNLARHRRQKHGAQEQAYVCEVRACGKKFKRQDARLKHYRRRHQWLAPVPPVLRK